MADLLEQGAAWLEDQRTRHLSRMVTYLRAGDSVDLAATIGSTTFEQADEYGVIHRTESRDHLITAANLVLAGKQELPKPGDRIRETDGAQIFLYEVMAPGGEPAWRYSDAYRRTLRIHTKHVGMER
ncbi:MAG TPA: hypothetical protein VFH17_02725 [Coriobacteriia bacterium]|nr:hypothetical protein [Coriobacteriia bacterium]